MERIAVLGGGRMGAALVAGLLDAGLDAESLAVAEADAARRHELETLLPGRADRAERARGSSATPTSWWSR